MRLPTALRFAGWWWVLPLELILGYVFVLAAFPADSGYPLASQVVGNQAMALIAPVCAMAATWSAARLRRAGYDHRPRARQWLMTRAERLTPVVAMSLVAVLAGGLAASRPNLSVGWPDPRLLLIALLTLAASAAFGDLLGSHWPLRLAAPASVVLPYVLIAFPPAMEPLWLRHMVGVTNSCCFVYDTLATRVLVACCLTYLGLTVLALGLGASLGASGVARPRTRLSLAAATAIGAAAAVAVAAWSVSALGVMPTQSRSGEPACAGARPALCTWPEHAYAAKALARLAARVRGVAAADGGLPVPARLVERAPEQTTWPDAAADFNVVGDQARLDNELVYALAPQLTPPCSDSLQRRGLDPQVQAYSAATAAIIVWWQETLALPVVAAQDDPGEAAQVARLRGMTHQQATRELADAIRRMGRCEPLARQWTPRP